MHGGDESSAVGSRLVRVQCDKCGCEYFYELARVGSGQAHAPYAIGTRIALRRAEERAQRDLAKRLENDAELVPCPKLRVDQRGAGLAIPPGSLSRVGDLRGVHRLPGNQHRARSCAWFLSIGPRRTARRRAVLAGSGSDDLDCRRSARAASPHLAQEPNPAEIGPIRSPQNCHPEGQMHCWRTERAVSSTVQFRRPCKGTRLANGSTSRSADRRFLHFAVFVSVNRNPGPGAAIQCSEVAVLLVPFCSRCAHEWKLRVWLVGLIAFGAVGRTCVRGAAAPKLDPLAFWVSFVLVCGATPLLAAGVAYRLTTPVRVKSADASRALARLWFRSEPYLESRLSGGARSRLMSP